MEQFLDGPTEVAEDPHVYDVAVIGLGPVGASAALLLARQGLSVIAIEPSATPFDKPRAIGIDHEAMRMLQHLGLTEALAPHIGTYRVSEYRSAAGEVLRRIVPQPEPHPLAWPPYNTFVQPDLERILRDALEECPTLDIRYGRRCVALSQDGSTTFLTLEGETPDDRQLVRARYTVGCDGAWSPTRESLGIKFEDLEFDEPWLVIDMMVEDDAELPDAIVQYCDPARPATFVHGPGKLRRWEIMLLPDEIPAEMLEECVIWSLLSKWLRPDQGRIWRAATYRFHALVAERWFDRRIFIAGDAAHQTPPFMAQGLNQGFRDVINLAWKLGEVILHGASPTLLDSYDDERRPNARAVIGITKDIGKIICLRDEAAAADRNRTMLAEMAAGRGEIIRQDLLPPIRSGFLLRGDDGALSPGAGKVFPQSWVRLSGGGRARMDDILDARFLQIVRPDWRPAVGDVDIAAALGVTYASLGDARVAGRITILEESGLARDWMAAHDATSVIVRPDHVVFGTCSSANAESELLASLRAMLGDEATPAAARSSTAGRAAPTGVTAQ